MRYEGQLKNGVKHGKGKEISRDGRDNYEGEFKEGLRNGKGKLTCFSTKYEDTYTKKSNFRM